MAFNFSANQYDRFYKPSRLGNWEMPKFHPPMPRQLKGCTKIISNDRGHLLPDVKRFGNHPWSNFRSTYELPNRITRQFVEEYHACLLRRDKYKNYPHLKYMPSGEAEFYKTPTCPTKCENAANILAHDKMKDLPIKPWKPRRMRTTGEINKECLCTDNIKALREAVPKMPPGRGACVDMRCAIKKKARAKFIEEKRRIEKEKNAIANATPAP